MIIKMIIKSQSVTIHFDVLFYFGTIMCVYVCMCMCMCVPEICEICEQYE